MRSMGVALCIAGVLSPAQARVDAPRQVGIFSVSTAGLDPNLQRSVMDALATATAATGKWQVVSRSELAAMLGAERLKDTVGCSDVSCIAEIGNAAGVGHIMAGSVSTVENTFVISLQLIDTRRAAVDNRVTLSWDGPRQDLTDALGAAAEQLVMSPTELTGALRVSGAPASATWLVDGEAKGVGPGTVPRLKVGVHHLQVDAPNYDSWQRAFIVRSGQTTNVPVSLTETQDSPFYAKWWFWTAGAAVVGGAVATAILLGQKDSQAGVEFTSTVPGE